MRKSILGKTGLEVSMISMGGLVLRNCDQQQADEIFDKAAAAGVTYFDSAPTYADSQALFGNAPAEIKNRFLIGAKSTKRDYYGCMGEIEQSLRKLKVDVLDIFHLHAVLTDDDWDERKQRDGALEALIRAKEKGLVRFLGITGHNDPSVFVCAINDFDFDVVMPAVNYLYRYFLNPEAELLPLAKEKNLGIMAIKPNIQNKAVDETAAYRYVFSQGAHTALPPGDPEAFFRAVKIADKIEVFSKEEEEEFLLNVPDLKGICRQCGECMQPESVVDIPYLFIIECKFRLFGHLKRIAQEQYREYIARVDVQDFLSKSEPISCPWCIDILDRLRKLHKDILTDN